VRRRVYGSLAVLLGLTYAFLEREPLADLLSSWQERATAPVPVHLGQRLPLSGLATALGTPISPQALQGRIVILEFWATWCRPCIEGFPEFDRLARSHAGDDTFVFLAVNIDGPESANRAQRVIRENPYAFLHLVDSRRTVFNRANARGAVPLTAVLDAQGVLRYSVVGRLPSHAPELERLLRMLSHRPSLTRYVRPPFPEADRTSPALYDSASPAAQLERCC
jgi:thiol-disulfide isomerase/thioredoxin